MFDDLTETERGLLAAAAAGDPFGGAGDRVRAEVVRHLLVSGEWQVHAHGVEIVDVRIDGTLDLTSARVRCPLALRGCQVDALAANGATVAGHLDLTRTTFDGPVDLLGAVIAGPVEVHGTRVRGTDGTGNAFIGDRLVVHGDLRCIGAGFAGAVRLVAATVDGQLMVDGAVIEQPDTNGDAFVAFGCRVDGDAFLIGNFGASGRVHLRSARFGGSLQVVDVSFAGDVAFYAPGAHVTHDFWWQPGQPVGGKVNLERMTVGRLDDDWTRPGADWPPAGQLKLAGFTYQGFKSDATVAQRLDWVRRQGPFSMQPYEQLIRVYREAGQDADARTVAIARRNDLRKYGEMTPLRKAGNRLLDVTLKHGYQPGRAVVGLLVLYLAMVAVFGHARMVPADAKATATTQCAQDYPCYSSWTYALDLVVPILDVPDGGAWRPHGDGYVALAVVATFLGWAFSTLAVLGWTGVVRRE